MPQSVLAGKTYFVQNQGRPPQSITADEETIRQLGGILITSPDDASCIIVDLQAPSEAEPGAGHSGSDLVEIGLRRGIPLVDSSWVATCNATGKEASYAAYAPWIIRARQALPRHGVGNEVSGTTARALSVSGARVTDVCARSRTPLSTVSLPELRSPTLELSTSPNLSFPPSHSSELSSPVCPAPPKRATSDPLPSFLKRTHTIDKLKRRRYAPPPRFPGRLALAGVQPPLEVPESPSVPLSNGPQMDQTQTNEFDSLTRKRTRRGKRQKATARITSGRPPSKRSKVANGAVDHNNGAVAGKNGTSEEIGRTQVCFDFNECSPNINGGVNINECTFDGKATDTTGTIAPSSYKDVDEDTATSISAPETLNAGLPGNNPAVLLRNLAPSTRAQVLWIADKLQLWIGLEDVREFLAAHANDEGIPNVPEIYDEHETLVTALVTTAVVDHHSWSTVEAAISQLLARDCGSQDGDAVEAELESGEILETHDLGEADMDICTQHDRADAHECSVEVASPAAGACGDESDESDEEELVPEQSSQLSTAAEKYATSTTLLPTHTTTKAVITRPTMAGVYDLLGIPPESHGIVCSLISHLRSWDKRGCKRAYIRKMGRIPGLLDTYAQYKVFINAHIAGGLRTRRSVSTPGKELTAGSTDL